jgi:hypothetical protein
MILSYLIQAFQLLEPDEAIISSDDGEINHNHWKAIVGDICYPRTQ